MSARAVIIASGVRRRSLNIPGEREFERRGIIRSGAEDPSVVRGKRVLIVGGGDAALENALILSKHAESVQVAFRRKQPTARQEFVNDAQKNSRITLLPRTIVRSIGGDDIVKFAELECVGTKDVRKEPIDVVLIRIGFEPNSEFIRSLVNCDDGGYIQVDSSCRTSREVIYAVGDVANPVAPTIATAVGTGAIAAKSIFSMLRA